MVLHVPEHLVRRFDPTGLDRHSGRALVLLHD
jgi:hypothetical protein